jgi:hypothetical protein
MEPRSTNFKFYPLDEIGEMATEKHRLEIDRVAIAMRNEYERGVDRGCMLGAILTTIATWVPIVIFFTLIK